ncbi:MAG: hypothetical protein AB8H79_19615 [Myxococcota bacterium]
MDVRVLCLVVGLTACAARGSSGQKTAALGSQMFVEPATAVPLGGLHTPFEDGFLPPLSGDASTLDLKSLTRSTMDYTIHADTGAMAELDETGTKALILLLASDPRWRVFEAEEHLVATRRTQERGQWSAPLSGYHASNDGPWRTQLRFGAFPDSHPWRTSPHVARVDAGDPEVKVRGFVPPSSLRDADIITALSVEGPSVSLDLYETGPEGERPRTGDALSEVPAIIANAAMLSDRLHKRGHEPMLLPPDEPAAAPVSVSVSRLSSNEMAWHARVNPGEPGWVWLQLDQGGAAWQHTLVAAATRERVGWAKEGNRSFLANSTFHVPSGEAIDATAQVWFLPDSGDARVLHTMQVRVPAS